ncbi:sigma-70 family RNA polymerase sigma factor [Parabacteroides sp. GYB001]|uniref:sigma-70 family RNA polymerase sigma factor n=1 Tax=Parabacteroides leei TaxID=2939491 RepID=UPI0020182979|nr:sigma-70 family RNA polymerase sigma factor [Parabacteroides leei]MCL3853650.1 sigma-70 family RNA polymerase sigma factor [Parabacteroides leei]
MDKKELVDLCKSGDEQALDLLYKTYSGKMMRICLHYVSDRQIAQDLLHDGFIVIFTSIDSLRNPEKLESWMGIIMKNISLRYLNQNNAANMIPLSEIPEEDEPTGSFFEADFMSYDQIMELVESLPEGYSKVFKLAVLEGLPHKEIGNLLNIASHSSSSQLYRAKSLLKKMIGEYRLVLVLLLILFVPLFYKYVCRWPRQQKQQPKDLLQQMETVQKKENEQSDSTEPVILSGKAERPQQSEMLVAPSLVYAEKTPSLLLPKEIAVDVQPVTKPLFVSELSHNNTVFISHPLKEFTSMRQSRKSNKWKFMLAGSLGPQLAQNLYKLIATPHSGSEENPDLPQQVSTWEDYYTYLQTRYQEGTLGDSLTLMQIAGGNRGKIVEYQHHDSPITLGLSVNKKLDDRWSFETGLQYIFLKSDFITGEEYRIQETQKLHYIGLPFRVSYRWGNFRKFSFYSTAGVQVDIPLKGTLRTFHVTDSVPVDISRQSLAVPMQWSVNASAGVQYHFTRHISFYVEPTLNYYIPDGSGLRTIRREHPVTFTVPVGLRFSW